MTRTPLEGINAMKTVYTPLHIAAIAVGSYCTGVEVYSSTEHLSHAAKMVWYLDPSILAVIGTSIGTCIAMACVYRANRDRQYISALMLFVAFLFGAGYTLTVTLERVSAGRDAMLTAKWAADPEIQRLTKVRDQMTYITTRERTEGNRNKGRAAGTGEVYNGAQAEAKIATDLMNARKAELDSMAQRISAMTLGLVSVQNASMFQPVLLPISLFLMGAYFIAFGLAGSKVKPEFDLTPVGKDADEVKAQRFIETYRSQRGRDPKICEIERTLGVSNFVARRMYRDYAKAA